MVLIGGEFARLKCNDTELFGVSFFGDLGTRVSLIFCR